MLNGTYFDWERQLFVQFAYEEIMTQCLSHFHNTNDGRINLILTILIDTLFGRFLLFRLQRRTRGKHSSEEAPTETAEANSIKRIE